MSAGYLELFLEQGEDFSATVTLDALNGSVYNLDQCIAKSEIRKSHWSQDASASFATSVDGFNGTIGLSLTAEETQGLSAGRYVYDVFITGSNGLGSRSKVLEGILFVDPSSTKI